MQTLLKSTRRERFAYAEKLTERKKKDPEGKEASARRCCSGFPSGGMCCCALPGPPAPLTNVDYTRSRGCPGSHADPCRSARKLVSDAEGAIDKLERNVNARLLAEVTLLDWPHG